MPSVNTEKMYDWKNRESQRLGALLGDTGLYYKSARAATCRYRVNLRQCGVNGEVTQLSEGSAHWRTEHMESLLSGNGGARAFIDGAEDADREAGAWEGVAPDLARGQGGG
jgi:hypothetical protein